MIWLMEGLSSQRGIVQGIRDWIKQSAIHTGVRYSDQKIPLQVLASHRSFRPEITGEANIALREPTDDHERLAFILSTVAHYSVKLLHVGRHCNWFEAQRAAIEASGVTLVTGARGVENFMLADDKYAFTSQLIEHAIPHIAATYVTTLDELQAALQSMQTHYPQLCIKPNKGIYGAGYWRLDDSVAANHLLLKPEERRINTNVYLDIVAQNGGLSQPMIVMPYLPGPECSIDMVVEAGQVIAAVGRRKHGSSQTLFMAGEEIMLARRCAALLHADGLVNVQTREDDTGQPRVLECNLRPSGGVVYGLEVGANLPAIMVASRLGYSLPSIALSHSTVRIIDRAFPIPTEDNLDDNWAAQ